MDALSDPLAFHVWDTKYRCRDEGKAVDADVAATWQRVARALAAVEPASERPVHEARFNDILSDFRYLPGGRILAGAGSRHHVTLFNCFVMPCVPDSLDGIFESIKQGAITLQHGGGIGVDFSTLRPAGSPVHGAQAVASGPVSFMRIWDAMCRTLLSTGARRGAMMATLRCDHPDLVSFIEAKRDARELRHFNLSVLVSDAFMEAVLGDHDWPLVFPLREDEPAMPGDTIPRAWSGMERPVPCRIHAVVRARELWERIMRATYDCAEPGVLFVDSINRWNNLRHLERISATNPCGEVPLPAWGSCDLGSINLTRFVREAFTGDAHLDWNALSYTAAIAVRMLDDVIDASRYPLPLQEQQARLKRRIGLGITGLADALILLGLRYDSEPGRAIASAAMRCICHAAYRASVELARTKGPYPAYDRDACLSAPFIAALPEDIRAGIAVHGLRNSHLTSIAPAGTISLLAGNVSSGIEPVFAHRHRRAVVQADGSRRVFEVEGHALREWRRHCGDRPVPESFVEARAVAPLDHLRMQAALQPFVDNAISKTINVPEDFPFDSFRSLYEQAWRMGLKGCTTYRPNPVTGAVLDTPADADEGATRCCTA